jgi:hypothetical protein
MGFNQNIYVFAGIFALYGIYAAATEGVSKAWISISNERILRLLSVPILLFKLFHHARQFHGGIDLVPVWRGHRFSSNCICQYFNGLCIFMTTEKSNINILP